MLRYMLTSTYSVLIMPMYLVMAAKLYHHANVSGPECDSSSIAHLWQSAALFLTWP